MIRITGQGGSPISIVRIVAFAAIVISWMSMVAADAHAVPSYSRRYGVECSTCHTMWGALNVGGVTFRLSGYRAVNGKDLTPVTEDTEFSKGQMIPATLPLSIITGVGLETRSEKREILATGSTAGSSAASDGTSLALEDLSIFLTGPIGKHFSAFIEFPMFETRAWEFTPTGKSEAGNVNPANAAVSPGPGRQIAFRSESPVFEVAKFWINNLAGEGVQRDSLNLLTGITHLPLAYAPGKVRLSVNQYLIYERTALELISPNKVGSMLGGDPNDFLFRLSEPQVMTEVNGMLLFGKPVTDVAKRDTFWAEYHLGVTNGSNAHAANNGGVSVYGRGIVRYYNQSFGVFAFSSPDMYSDSLRASNAVANNPLGIMSGRLSSNAASRTGIDATLSLAPFGIPVALENQYMWNSESDPTGFGVKFDWEGGFHQLNWLMSKTSVAYARYDYVTGGAYNDTSHTVIGFNNGSATGITNSHPKEEDYVVGYQHLIEQNIKLIVEFRTHQFDDTATGANTTPTRLTDQGGTFRVMFGF